VSEPAPTIKHMIEETLSSSNLDSGETGSGETGSAEPPLEWLETQICELAGHLAAATYRFLVLLGDFDERRGWAEWDLPSCSAWLSWKCQLTSGTAREHVRVARALRTLPVLSAEFAAGRMSFAKIRALTRIATPATDADLAEVAGPMTASQLERFARAHRQVTRADDGYADTMRRLTWRQDEDGSLSLTVRLPPADGAVVLQALRAATGDLDRQAEHEEHESVDRVSAETSAEAVTTPASLADALVEIASAFLGHKIETASNPDIYQVILHVGTEALTADTNAPGSPDVSAETPVGHPAHPSRCHIEDGPAISRVTAQAIACCATVSSMLHDRRGDPLDVGRRQRTPPPALRRAVRERDRYRCQYPGCDSRKVQIHHIRHWSKGGETKLRNLMLLCRAHHSIVHDLNYGITAAADGFVFTTADGEEIDPSPPFPSNDGTDIRTCHDARISPDTIIPAWYGDKLDLDHAIWACFANAKIAATAGAVP
jgi:5-methylcytosine-specific restriction endonuclease McrA